MDSTEIDVAVLHPLSKTTDPFTSRKAEEELQRSGKLGTQLQETLCALMAWPVDDPPTSRELGGAGNDRLQYIYARRLSDLKALGRVKNVGARPCRVTTKTCITWAIVR